VPRRRPMSKTSGSIWDKKGLQF